MKYNVMNVELLAYMLCHSVDAGNARNGSAKIILITVITAALIENIAKNA